MSQMGTLISLDCLLYQMKAERAVDIYGVTLQLARSCCLMTPTLVGGKKGCWAGWGRVLVLSLPSPGCSLLPGSLASLSRDLFQACSPPCGSATHQGLRALTFPRQEFSISSVLSEDQLNCL